MKNYWDLKPEDFPMGEPVLKMKNGYWYRPDNNGYTDDIMKAGLYEREKALANCFHGKDRRENGNCEVLAVPIRLAIKEHCMSRKRIQEYRERLDELEKYVTDEILDYVIF